jgi:hypothetical protein
LPPSAEELELVFPLPPLESQTFAPAFENFPEAHFKQESMPAPEEAEEYVFAMQSTQELLLRPTVLDHFPALQPVQVLLLRPTTSDHFPAIQSMQAP